MRRRIVSLIVAASLLSGCSALQGSPPAPTPGDFGAFAIELSARGIDVSNVVSGDAGCNDPTLAPTAISFHATGLDQTSPVPLRLYIFGDDSSYGRRRADVDTCAQAWATDPVTFEFVDASPFVLAGQGPWAANFASNLRAALTNAAGD